MTQPDQSPSSRRTDLEVSEVTGSGVSDRPTVPTPELVRDLLSSDGRRRPGDERLTGLGAALATLDRDLQHDVSAALYCAAAERLTYAEEAETRAKYISADEFRKRNLMRAEHMARLWREACHAR